jgi:hypothetical protein
MGYLLLTTAGIGLLVLVLAAIAFAKLSAVHREWHDGQD